MTEPNSEERISRLLHTLLDTYEPCYGLGSMAWLFPSSFLYVLDAQLPDGRWTAHPGEENSDEVDGILSTMAASYCLIQHAKTPLQLKHIPRESLAERIRNAIACLRTMLQLWRVGDSKAVGFEVLAPSLLNLLEQEGHIFDFPGKEHLLHVRDQKLAKVSPELLYNKSPSALLHSLEAFHYRKDISYDRFAHQKVGGSMMASPSATASYLIRCNTWDDEAEAYLRLVLSNGHGQGFGGVPSAYPSTNFELTWVVSTLLEAGLWTKDLKDQYAAKILTMLEDSRKLGKGLVGFGESTGFGVRNDWSGKSDQIETAPGIEPDLDDSAKSSIIFNLLGRRGFSSQVVEHFDSTRCLKTYKGERNPSLSANCNALLSILLDLDDSRSYQSLYPPSEKIALFICDSWWNTSGPLDDKWNLSPFYPAMLMVQSLMELLHKWHAGKLPELECALLPEKVVPTLFQCLGQLLQSQNADGSWGCRGPREETAYALLALTNLVSLSPSQYFGTEIMSAIHRGRSFLRQPAVGKLEYLWIEKVTYASENLAEAYVVAALYASNKKPSLSYTILQLCDIDLQALEHVAPLAEKSPMSGDGKWLVRLSWIMSGLYIPFLQRTLGKRISASYQATAFRWMFANSRVASPLSPKCLLEMITAAILIDDIAAIIHDCIALGNDKNASMLTSAIHTATIHLNHHNSTSKNGESNGTQVFEPPPKANGRSPPLPNGDFSGGTCHSQCNGLPMAHLELSSIEETLSSFLDFFDMPESLSKASEADRHSLQAEVKHFMSAQYSWASFLEEQVHGSPLWPNGIDYERTIHCHGMERLSNDSSRERSARLTGLPVLFAFAICLTSHKGRESSPSMSQLYMATDVRNSIATVFKLEQAAVRPRGCNTPTSMKSREEHSAATILAYERERLRLALEHLEIVGVGPEVLGATKVVAEVAHLTAKLPAIEF
ncbi:MAG: hypothetical protein LQ344_007210 [Seirophora lacunosa]|nr:MAG: hypothetical protein LQ344_007210 [Seirophora lacunosa]